MPGFGFGTRAAGRRRARGQAPLVLSPGTLSWASLRAPPENGDNPGGYAAGVAVTGENAMLRTAWIASLVDSASPFMATQGALLFACTLDQAIYNGLVRSPYVCGNAVQTTTVGARTIGIRYTPRPNPSTISTPGTFTAWVRGESGASAGVKVETPDVPHAVQRLLGAVRFDGTSFCFDFWDCDTGTKYAGTPAAKPVGWAGITVLSSQMALFGARTTDWPNGWSATNGNSVNLFRGEIEFLSWCDVNPSEAQLQAIATGADPVAELGASALRLHCPLVSGGAENLIVQSNRATVNGQALVRLGTFLPGSTIRRQAPARHFIANRLLDPALVVVPHGETTAPLALAYRFAGVSGAIALRLQDEDGAVIGPDWRTVGALPANGSSGTLSLKLPWHPHHRCYRLTLRVADGQGGYLYHRINSDVVVSYGLCVLDQSGWSRAVAFGNTLGLGWSAEEGRRSFVVDYNASANSPVIRRTRFASGDARHDGHVLLTQRLREKTQRPLVFVNATQTGTDVFDLLNDDYLADGAADTDQRKWSHLRRRLEALAPADDSGRRTLTALATQWAVWFHPRSDWSAQVLRPLVTGRASATQGLARIHGIAQGDIHHHLYDGVDIDPRFRTVVAPLYRACFGFGTASDGAMAVAALRADMRDNAVAVDPARVVVGYESANHAVVSQADVHPSHYRMTGMWPLCRQLADSLAVGAGLEARKGPFLFDRFAWGATQAEIVARVSGGGALDTEGNLWAARYGGVPGNPLGQAVEGFEVQDGGTGEWTNAGFTAAITAAGAVTLTKASGTWLPGTRVMWRPGAPGGYATHAGATGTAGTLAEDNWVKRAVFCDGAPVSGSNTAYAVA